ncbi:MAG: hypothetical protein ACLQU9_16690 [Acidimicrobiales bacterium]|jgi:hypothetical protein
MDVITRKVLEGTRWGEPCVLIGVPRVINIDSTRVVKLPSL